MHGAKPKGDTILHWGIIAGLMLVGAFLVYRIIKGNNPTTSTAATASGTSPAAIPGANSNPTVEYIPTSSVYEVLAANNNNNTTDTTVNTDHDTGAEPAVPVTPVAPATPTPNPPVLPPSPHPVPVPPTPAPNLGGYRVVAGDALWSIAQKHHTTAAAIGNANNNILKSTAAQHGISPSAKSKYGNYPAAWDFIVPGEVLQVPGA
jgi:LysM repeat protein